MRIVIKDIMNILKCNENTALKIEEAMECEDFDFSQATKQEFNLAVNSKAGIRV